MEDFTWFIILLLIFLLADDEPMPRTEEARSFLKIRLEELQIDDCNSSLDKLHE